MWLCGNSVGSGGPTPQPKGLVRECLWSQGGSFYNLLVSRVAPSPSTHCRWTAPSPITGLWQSKTLRWISRHGFGARLSSEYPVSLGLLGDPGAIPRSVGTNHRNSRIWYELLLWSDFDCFGCRRVLTKSGVLPFPTAFFRRNVLGQPGPTRTCVKVFCESESRNFNHLESSFELEIVTEFPFLFNHVAYFSLRDFHSMRFTMFFEYFFFENAKTYPPIHSFCTKVILKKEYI